MVNILLVCNAGMSTSMLVNKMKAVADLEALDVHIWAVGDAASKSEVVKADIVCLGPQVRYLERKMKERVSNEKPVMIIDTAAYGTMNGEKVLKAALSTVETWKKSN